MAKVGVYETIGILESDTKVEEQVIVTTKSLVILLSTSPISVCKLLLLGLLLWRMISWRTILRWFRD